jgi:hypothetical protein
VEDNLSLLATCYILLYYDEVVLCFAKHFSDMLLNRNMQVYNQNIAEAWEDLM